MKTCIATENHCERINKLEKSIQYRDWSWGNMFHIWIMNVERKKKNETHVPIWMQFFNVPISISSIFIFACHNFLFTIFFLFYLLEQPFSMKHESNNSLSLSYVLYMQWKYVRLVNSLAFEWNPFLCFSIFHNFFFDFVFILYKSSTIWTLYISTYVHTYV